jgi:hypothetical protein
MNQLTDFSLILISLSCHYLIISFLIVTNTKNGTERKIWVPFNFVAFLLKARIVKTAETAVARKRLCNHDRCSAMAQYPSCDRCHTLAIMEDMFSVRSVPAGSKTRTSSVMRRQL